MQLKDDRNHTRDENESTDIYRDSVNELVNKKCEKSQKTLIFLGYRTDIL